MIYRFEILTADYEVYEGWACNPDEMRDNADAQLPAGTDFEVFLSAVPFEHMSLNMYRDCVANELPDYLIRELDAKVGVVLAQWTT